MKILEIIPDKCKQLNEPPPKPQQEQQKKVKSVPLTDKTKPNDQTSTNKFLIIIYITRCPDKA